MMIFKQNTRLMSCYFLTFKILINWLVRSFIYIFLCIFFQSWIWNLVLCNYLVALKAVRSIMKLISNPDLSRPGQGTDLNFQSKIDFLKVLRFSFPVPVVSPCTEDFYHLQRAKNLREEFSSSRFYPITNGFTDAPLIKPDHATCNVTRTVLIQIRIHGSGLFWHTLTARDDTPTRQHTRQGRK